MIFQNYDLTDLNTFKTRVSSRWLVLLQKPNINKEEMDLINTNKSLCLGSGSNLFFTKDYDGVVVKNEIKGKEVFNLEKDHVEMEIGAGEDWNNFVAWSLEQGFFGLENLSLIPGTVGAGPVQNIGAYGKEISEFITSVKGISLPSGETKTYLNNECLFDYRDSIFKNKLKNKFIITSVNFKLSLNPVVDVSYKALSDKIEELGVKDPTPSEIRNIVISIRRSKLPDWQNTPNAGSFFKNAIISNENYNSLLKKYPNLPGYPKDSNNTKVPTAWLLDKAGWKGFWNENVGCYKKQPLVIVTNGKASGEEIVNFARDIIKDIENKFGITLVSEVTSIGDDI